ncbi:disintegrin and metalloproteinase domain-containing protein 21-like [Ochotona curzoniae]|uniref:disintegrin and metalloproteinase domain-containing protein 21-like n=1 Tax=Ochotona curzoniae TaxID=130825 RepID=UPI001B346B14|nr:disintegrin and metalloproteinase domain-containing protein 21-like [Ochotona curzoniae]
MMLADRWVTLLLLELVALLDAGQCSGGRPVWRYISSEVVIPRKEVHHGKGVEVPGWLSYSLRFGGQRHIIRVRSKKLVWSRHLLMTTQDDQGALQMDYPYIPMDCHYLGYLEDIPLSTVTVNTCYGGLEGVMKLDDLAYEIKPLQDSHTFEHIVSQIVADHDATGPTYTLEQKEEFDSFFPERNGTVSSRISSFNYLFHIAHLKGHIQFSNGMYRVFNNVTKCVHLGINMFSVIDSFLRGIAFTHYIFLLTVYDVQDPTNMDDVRVPGSAMSRHYVQTFYKPTHLRPYISTMLTPDKPDDSEIKPKQYGVCSNENLLVFAFKGRHYLLLAVLSTHHISRMIGLGFDHTYCYCQRRTTCFMMFYPEITDAYSNCSIIHLQHVVTNARNEQCYYLTTPEVYLNKSLIQTRCGNSIVEESELCDCGSFKQCYANKCCQSNCEFTPGSVCDKQQCCSNCTYSPATTLCRSIRNICDLPEYCLGSLSMCPEDFYLQDGTPCTEEGYCYKGNCTDRSMHCKEIFGARAENGPEDCYAVNLISDRFGHCGRNKTALLYFPCAVKDKMCGRLQCINVFYLPQLQEHVSFHQSVYNNYTCFGLDDHRATGATDAGRVRTGTLCGPGKFCQDNTCSGDVTALQYDCVPEKCSFRGVCNNKRNCHCHVGWEPPLCLNRGAGGSSDSGPQPRRLRTVRSSLEPIVYWRLVISRIYCFLLALFCGVVTRLRHITTTVVMEETTPETH